MIEVACPSGPGGADPCSLRLHVKLPSVNETAYVAVLEGGPVQPHPTCCQPWLCGCYFCSKVCHVLMIMPAKNDSCEDVQPGAGMFPLAVHNH